MAGKFVFISMLILDVKSKNPVLSEGEFNPLKKEKGVARIDGSACFLSSPIGT